MKLILTLILASFSFVVYSQATDRPFEVFAFEDDGGEHYVASSCKGYYNEMLTSITKGNTNVKDARLEISSGYIFSELITKNPSGADIYRHFYNSQKECENANFALDVLQGFVTD